MTAPGVRGAAVGRRIAAGLVGAGWRTRTLGAWRVPAAGPVILAGNHAHNVDGPVVMACSPRPVRFLVKREAFAGPAGVFLHAIGQIDVDRGHPDRAAVTAALGVLEAGEVLGIFPEGTRSVGDFAAIRSGLAYFALRSAASVVPVAVLGSGDRPGRLIPALPPLRGRIDVVFGEPFTVEAGGGRRTRAALDEATARIQARLTGHLKDARRRTGR
ncbi:lysophospholipid acyltransferase family protein [Streptomyces sp. URMC 129]|uniref:lysophospholipid acyltransferase family protein n=1 Tax=Streptomyces sp. URMC 129 TaxID=3423407 RepID=UPI003F1A1057